MVTPKSPGEAVVLIPKSKKERQIYHWYFYILHISLYRIAVTLFSILFICCMSAFAEYTGLSCLHYMQAAVVWADRETIDKYSFTCPHWLWHAVSSLLCWDSLMKAVHLVAFVYLEAKCLIDSFEVFFSHRTSACGDLNSWEIKI